MLPIPNPPSRAVARQLTRRKFNDENPYGSRVYVMGSVLAEPTVDLVEPELDEVQAWLTDCDAMQEVKSGGQTTPGGCPTHLGSNWGGVEGARGAKSAEKAAKLADRGRQDIYVGRTSNLPELGPSPKGKETPHEKR